MREMLSASSLQGTFSTDVSAVARRLYEAFNRKGFAGFVASEFDGKHEQRFFDALRFI